MRQLLRTGSSALLLLLIMFLGSLVLWVGIPVGWLYLGSQVQGATNSAGAAFGLVIVGILASIALVVPALGWLNRKHVELREARGLESHGNTALEAVLVVSAGLAVLSFSIWFFFFAGTSPIPLNLTY